MFYKLLHIGDISNRLTNIHKVGSGSCYTLGTSETGLSTHKDWIVKVVTHWWALKLAKRCLKLATQCPQGELARDHAQTQGHNSARLQQWQWSEDMSCSIVQVSAVQLHKSLLSAAFTSITAVLRRKYDLALAFQLTRWHHLLQICLLFETLRFISRSENRLLLSRFFQVLMAWFCRLFSVSPNKFYDSKLKLGHGYFYARYLHLTVHKSSNNSKLHLLTASLTEQWSKYVVSLTFCHRRKWPQRAGSEDKALWLVHVGC